MPQARSRTVFAVLFIFLTIPFTAWSCWADETIDRRPYEMIWANRVNDTYSPLVDFENLDGWRVQEENTVSTFVPTRERQLWGEQVAKLTYRALPDCVGSVRVMPPAPIPIQDPWSALSCWIYGNRIAGTASPIPPIFVEAIFLDSQGQELGIQLGAITWEGWFVPYHVLTDTQKKRLSAKAFFNGFRFTGIRDTEDRVIYLDNLAAFQEKRLPLKINSRPQRGIPMLPGAGTGLNTGKEQLPFPNNAKTILPDNATKQFKILVRQDKNTFYFEYRGADGNLTYRLQPQSGTWSDISAQWNGGAWFHPLTGGGVLIGVNGESVAPESIVAQKTFIKDDKVVSTWTVSAHGVAQDVSYTYRLWNKSLVIDTVSIGGDVAGVSYGHATGIANPRLVWNPFYTYNSLEDRPGVVVMGSPQAPLFLAGNTDWYLSNASSVWGKRAVEKQDVFYNGGTRYVAKTDGKRNDCFERFFITVAPQYHEVLPNIPNPKSPWIGTTGTHAWTTRDSSPNRQIDYDYFTKVRRYGMTSLVVTDHETMWRDDQESFTFRTKTAPGKGGDEGEAAYARFLQNKLGYIYGPYNQFCDIAPVNEYWSPDTVIRQPDGQLLTSWYRCYAVKPSAAVDFAEKLSPIIQDKFQFSAGYCDVHTVVTPWSKTDYDARVPGAGTFAATYYAYGEIMLLQKKAWNGPVYSEGGHHWPYSGLVDGNYGQDTAGQLHKNPWLVDFNLRKIHPLNTNFGMGSPSMFWGQDNVSGNQADYDRFFAAEIAFGHTSFFIPLSNDPTLTLRSYYMPLALHSRYALANVKSIQYADKNGRLFDTSQAVTNDVYKNSQIVTHYDDGTVTVVNGNTDIFMRVKVGGRNIILPPNGFAGWSSDGRIYVFSGDVNQHRADYSVSEKYIYVDGRGRFTRFARAASDKPAICRILSNSEFEIIPVDNADCGFAITAISAVALNEAGKKIGRATTRASRGLTYIIPVKGAFSYRVQGSLRAPKSPFDELPARVFPGQKVSVKNVATAFQISANTRPDTHLWLQKNGQWVDFQVIPLTSAEPSIVGNKLHLQLRSNLQAQSSFKVRYGNESKVVSLQPESRGTVMFDLGQPTRRESRLITLHISAGESIQTIRRVLLSDSDYQPIVPIPSTWKAGMNLRGKDEAVIDSATGAHAISRDVLTCGGVNKAGVSMSPPYIEGTGYTFITYDEVTLPKAPAVFRASVGKGDGGFQGDGIWFKVAVVEGNRQTIVAEQIVKNYEWKPIQADLAPWAGKKIKLQLISDPGPADNPIADWACWAEMRTESESKVWTRNLSSDLERYTREDGPLPLTNLTLNQLRSSKAGWLHYQGMGLSGGTGAYGSDAVLNGIKVGAMSPAPGQENKGIWDDAKVALTPEAIASLETENRFELMNWGKDYFAIRRFWIELELADGRKVSSQTSTTAFTQPPTWDYGAGIKVPFKENVRVDISFGP